MRSGQDSARRGGRSIKAACTATPRRAVVVAAVLCLLGALPAANAAADGSRQDARLSFTTDKPGKPSGLVLDVDYRDPEHPKGKPPAVRRVVTTLARGARYDTSVPERCTAPDAALMLFGEAACPLGSKVGVGAITLDTGLLGPGRFVDAEVDFLNDTNELIFLNTVRGSRARTVVRAQVTRRRTITAAPFLPGTPPEGAAIDKVHVKDFRIVERRAGERRAYITTPQRCPPSGRWLNKVTFTYADGVTQVVRSRSPCERGARAGGR